MTLSSRAIEAAWIPAQFFEYLSAFVGEWEAKTIKDQMESVGLVLVPQEPTDEMIRAGFKALGWTANTFGARNDAIGSYRAMLSAHQEDEDSEGKNG